MLLGPPKPVSKLKSGLLQLRVLLRSILIQQSVTPSQPKLLSVEIPKGLSSVGSANEKCTSQRNQATNFIGL
jgi:hypothetical protein